QHRQEGRVQRIQGNRRVEQSFAGGGAKPAEADGLVHRVFEILRVRLWDFTRGQVERRRNQRGDLFNGLVEDDFLQAASDVFPLALRGLIEELRVVVESLVQQAYDKQRLASAAASCFGETLQQEDIATLRLRGREFEEFTKLVEDEEQPFAFAISNESG